MRPRSPAARVSLLAGELDAGDAATLQRRFADLRVLTERLADALEHSDYGRAVKAMHLSASGALSCNPTSEPARALRLIERILTRACRGRVRLASARLLPCVSAHAIALLDEIEAATYALSLSLTTEVL